MPTTTSRSVSTSPYRYNPLHNDLDAYALAYGIATLMTNLFGRGKEPFWQQASTNLVKFVILLHKTLDDYVTLFQVYEHVINPDKLRAQDRGRASGASPRRTAASSSTSATHLFTRRRCAPGRGTTTRPATSMWTHWSPDLDEALTAATIPHQIEDVTPAAGRGRHGSRSSRP